MKNFRFLLAAAVVFAVGSAFTNAPKGEKAVANWYLPNSSTLLASDPAAQSFSSYNPASAHETPTGCDEGQRVCAAQFPSTSMPANDIQTKN